MEIIDNFLSDQDFKNISNLFLDVRGILPWYFGPSVTSNKKEEHQFVHLFYYHAPVTEWFNHLDPFRFGLDIKALIRIKANLNPRTHNVIEHGFHTDTDFPCKTAVYYVNTCNGYTKFETGEVVESVANRMVIFDSQTKHTGSTCTDEPARIVINFNYF